MNVIVNEGWVVSTAIFNALSILSAASDDPSASDAVCDGGPTIVPSCCAISKLPWLWDLNEDSNGSLVTEVVFKVVGYVPSLNSSPMVAVPHPAGTEVSPEPAFWFKVTS